MPETQQTGPPGTGTTQPLAGCSAVPSPLWLWMGARAKWCLPLATGTSRRTDHQLSWSGLGSSWACRSDVKG